MKFVYLITIEVLDTSAGYWEAAKYCATDTAGATVMYNELRRLRRRASATHSPNRDGAAHPSMAGVVPSTMGALVQVARLFHSEFFSKKKGASTPYAAGSSAMCSTTRALDPSESAVRGFFLHTSHTRSIMVPLAVTRR